MAVVRHISPASLKKIRKRAMAVWPEAAQDPAKPAPKRPKIRLAKLYPKHVVMIEVLRIIYSMQPCRINDPRHAIELARRGMFDPVDDFVWVDGAPTPTHTTAVRIRAAMSNLALLGLIQAVANASSKLRHSDKFLFGVTRDGEATLRDWDDPRSDGVFPIKSQD